MPAAVNAPVFVFGEEKGGNSGGPAMPEGAGLPRRLADACRAFVDAMRKVAAPLMATAPANSFSILA